MSKEIKKVQFVGSGISGCPLVRGNSSDLKCGNIYDIDNTRVEAGMLLLKICDHNGRILGTFPAQWFTPMPKFLTSAN